MLRTGHRSPWLLLWMELDWHCNPVSRLAGWQPPHSDLWHNIVLPVLGSDSGVLIGIGRSRGRQRSSMGLLGHMLSLLSEPLFLGLATQLLTIGSFSIECLVAWRRMAQGQDASCRFLWRSPVGKTSLRAWSLEVACRRRRLGGDPSRRAGFREGDVPVVLHLLHLLRHHLHLHLHLRLLLHGWCGRLPALLPELRGCALHCNGRCHLRPASCQLGLGQCGPVSSSRRVLATCVVWEWGVRRQGCWHFWRCSGSLLLLPLPHKLLSSRLVGLISRRHRGHA